MRKKHTFVLFLILVLGGGHPAAANEPIKVATTILPIKTFVQKVGGDRVEAFSLIPPGGNPHTYEPTPGQMKKFSQADFFVRLGMPFEFEDLWGPKLLALNKDIETVDVSTGIPKIVMPEFEGHMCHNPEHHHDDPHIWVSVRNAQRIVRTIEEALSAAYPEHADDFRDNAQRYLRELQMLDQEITIGLADVEQRSFFIYHPAWGYFAEDYNLTQVIIQQHGREPSARDLVGFVKLAKEKGITSIFVSPQFSDKSAQVIASEIGGRVVKIDPLGEDFVDNMRAAGRALREQ